MKTYHFKKQVDADGCVVLDDLPAHHEVDIVVVSTEPIDWRTDMYQWMAELRRTHPFATMSEEEILARLRETREQVWEERHGR